LRSPVQVKNHRGSVKKFELMLQYTVVIREKQRKVSFPFMSRSRFDGVVGLIIGYRVGKLT